MFTQRLYSVRGDNVAGSSRRRDAPPVSSRAYKEGSMATQQRTENRAGVIPGAAYFALELVERTQLTAIGLMQDTRAEVRVAVDAAIDLADKSLSSVFRIARKLTQRVDDAMAE